MLAAAKKLSQQAQLACLYEVTCLNKPGLVDPVDVGSHSDMDVFTFLRSSLSLAHYFEESVALGYRYRCKSASKTFSALRELGVKAEQDMFLATDGVNTHKGAIFSLGLCLAACGRLAIWESPQSLSALQEMIQVLAEPLATDFDHFSKKAKEDLTWGEHLYCVHGIKGVRGEALAGFPIVFEKGLPFYQAQETSQQDKMLDTLLYMAMSLEDTTLMKRSQNVNILQELEPLLAKYFDLRETDRAHSWVYLEQLNVNFKQWQWSLGGSADSLILVLLLSKLLEMQWLTDNEMF